MNFLEGVGLGVLQGLTEFLPVSSSGHLVLAKALLGLREQGIALEVTVHFGTLLAIITVFHAEVWKVLRDFLGGLLPGGSRFREGRGWRWAWGIIVGSVPAGLVGVGLRNQVEEAFSSPTLVCLALIVTGLVLRSTRWAKVKEREVRLLDALLVGLAQALSVLPGISRSGATISVGLWRGLRRKEAAELSFLLALPAILGASALEAKELLFSPPPSAPALLGGLIAAYISGYLALKLLLGVVRRGRLEGFSYYCWALGGLGLLVLWA
ncbi:MAG TPA: undecaprenyl-diphosphate phosphatase [Candidatus Latescibacteria bacterium]|nr:undecaprenyl-diphosphate phosphatase [Candidatus Latescibacterota bacterium]